MPEGASRLPERPSLEQLRKQAKDLLKQTRLDRPAATLAEAQLEIARRFGFASWPRLVHHVEGALVFDRLARRVQEVYRPGDEAALRRFSEVMDVWFSPQEIRVRLARDLEALGGRPAEPLTLDEARGHVARAFGFATWDKLLASVDAPDEPRPTAPATLSTSPPFYQIDWEKRRLELRPPPLSERDWDTIIGIMKEHRLRELQGGNVITDAALARLAALPDLTALEFGSDHVSDAGLRSLARLPQLEELACGGWKCPLTDAGLEVLRQLPRLRRFRMGWAQKITDAGTANLSFCDDLVEVDLMGTNTGDGTINALTGKKKLTIFKTGRLVTDAGLPLLRRLPVFNSWQGVEPKIGLMDFNAPSNQLLLDGPFTDAGLRALAGLEGLYGLHFFWHTSAMTHEGLAGLKDLPHLGHFGCRGELMNDVALEHVARIPNLRMLTSQDMAAGPAGFEALGRSRSLEYLWGRDCAGFESRGFAALARMPSLRGIGISLAKVDDQALSLLPKIPRLHQLVPIDLTDDGFQHVGRCVELVNLWCMYCRESGDGATEHLGGLSKLQTYYAGSTRITDRSLELLGHMTSLEKLEFWECGGITDAGLPHLARLPRLREIGMACPRITREGAAVFPASVRVGYQPA